MAQLLHKASSKMLRCSEMLRHLQIWGYRHASINPITKCTLKLFVLNLSKSQHASHTLTVFSLTATPLCLALHWSGRKYKMVITAHAAAAWNGSLENMLWQWVPQICCHLFVCVQQVRLLGCSANFSYSSLALFCSSQQWESLEDLQKHRVQCYPTFLLLAPIGSSPKNLTMSVVYCGLPLPRQGKHSTS